MQKIVPCLWFDGNAEEAVKFYTKVFKKSKVGRTSYFGESAASASGQPKGSVLTIEFSLNGQDFLALNGGPIFKFTEAISLMVMCDDQKEIDYYWNALTKGGEESVCGWLKDKFGLSWQVAPKMLSKAITDKDKARAERAMKAMMDMKKIDISTIEAAMRGPSGAKAKRSPAKKKSTAPKRKAAAKPKAKKRATRRPAARKR